MITSVTYRALKELEAKDGAVRRGATAMDVALAVWGDDPGKRHLFTAVSPQGNGACAGKKAWLCAGSMMGKLVKRGYAYKGERGYHLTQAGRWAIGAYESSRRPAGQ